MKLPDFLRRGADASDEIEARRLRGELGGRGLIVSWDGPGPDGLFVARASRLRGPTVERSGVTRVHAIELAAGVAAGA